MSQRFVCGGEGVERIKKVKIEKYKKRDGSEVKWNKLEGGRRGRGERKEMMNNF